jgi:peptide/nickel transport system permease protein
VIDIFLVLPGLPLMIVISAYDPTGGFWLLVAVIVVTGWAFGARQIRSQAVSLRHRQYIEAARARGEGGLYVVMFELLPPMIPLLAATFLTAALYAVLAAAGLQFLGIGGVTSVSWGSMLYNAQNNEALSSGQVMWVLAPGLCVGLLGATFAMLNYGVDAVTGAETPGSRTRGVE